jgi:transposase
MSLVLDDPPRDPDRMLLRLQQMTEVIAQQNASLASLQTERDTAFAERDAAQAEVEKLRLLIRKLQRGQFGRHSERLDPDQLQLGLEDLEQTAAAAEAAQEEVTARNGTPRTPRVRRRNLGALPAHLPRIETVVDIENKTCPCCGGALHVIGEDTSEMLDLVPAQLRVKVIRRPRYGCRACEEAVVQAPAPERPITGGMATEALLAHVLVAKYADFLPLYRQAQIFAGTSWPRPGSSPMTRACRCSIPAGVGPRPAACGAMRLMTDPGAARPRRRWSTSMPRTAKASTRQPTWPSSRASCRWTATQGSRAC